MIYADVKYTLKRPIEQVILTFDASEYRMLIACLRSHANNEGCPTGYHVINCGTASTVLTAIEAAVNASK